MCCTEIFFDFELAVRFAAELHDGADPKVYKYFDEDLSKWMWAVDYLPPMEE